MMVVYTKKFSHKYQGKVLITFLKNVNFCKENRFFDMVDEWHSKPNINIRAVFDNGLHKNALHLVFN
jgi:hypothetical protein